MYDDDFYFNVDKICGWYLLASEFLWRMVYLLKHILFDIQGYPQL